MDRITAIKDGVLAALAAGSAIFIRQLGGWDAGLKVLLAFMGADLVLGLVVAGVFKRSPKSAGGALESQACFKGLCRKGVVLLFVWLGALLDALTGAEYVRTAVCLFFIANEGLSILESTAVMGVPYPAFIRDMLEAMRDKSGEAKQE